MPTVANQNRTNVLDLGFICAMIAISEQQKKSVENCEIWHNLENCEIWTMPDTSQYDADPVIRLSEIYSVDAKDRAEVAAYIRENPDLMPVLELASDHIWEFFPSSGLNIEMFADPESESTELAVVIHYDGEPENTTDRLLEFTRSWWGRVARPLAGRMMVCLE
jgi:hypothetical protein